MELYEDEWHRRRVLRRPPAAVWKVSAPLWNQFSAPSPARRPTLKRQNREIIGENNQFNQKQKTEIQIRKKKKKTN